MEVKHTPGPWEVGDLDHAGQRIVRQEHIEICTCWHHSVGSIELEMEANARLIAAAPKMLAACHVALAALQRQDRYDVESADALEEAIAEAEGRS